MTASESSVVFLSVLRLADYFNGDHHPTLLQKRVENVLYLAVCKWK